MYLDTRRIPPRTRFMFKLAMATWTMLTGEETRTFLHLETRIKLMIPGQYTLDSVAATTQFLFCEALARMLPLKPRLHLLPAPPCTQIAHYPPHRRSTTQTTRPLCRVMRGISMLSPPTRAEACKSTRTQCRSPERRMPRRTTTTNWSSLHSS